MGEAARALAAGCQSLLDADNAALSSRWMTAEFASFSKFIVPDLFLLAILATPGLIAIALVFYLYRRTKKPPPVPPVVQPPK